jgi:5-methylcytosine-specific restriction endonuclease McrA
MNDEMIAKAKYLAAHHFKGKDAGSRAKAWLFHALNEPCAYCGCELTLDNIQLDHWIPQSSKFKDVNSDENFVPSCKSCNLAKGALNGNEFVSLLDYLEEWEQYCNSYDCGVPTDNATVKFILTALKNSYKKAFKRR